MAERFIKHGNLQLWTESFGDSKNPALLLIMGIGGSGIIWPDKLCNLLANKGFFVIRYDNRDTGKSSRINFRKNPYNLDDMAGDAVAILDAYGIDKAGIVGASMGGVIAQLIALNYPERVSHLILMMTTPDLSVIVRSLIPFFIRKIVALFINLGVARSDLPAPQAGVIRFFRSQLFFSFKSQEQQLETAVQAWRVFSGGGIFDEDEMRTREKLVFSRANNHSAFINHAKAIIRSLGQEVALDHITEPTLIIHGALDPVFPSKHAQVLTQKIPGAHLEVLPEMGHIIPEKLSNKLAFFILNHLKKIS